MFERTKRCCVYQWKGQLIVVSVSRTVDGFGVEFSPRLLESPTPMSLSHDVLLALDASKGKVPNPGRRDRWLVLDVVGVRSESAFYAEASEKCLDVTSKGSACQISIWTKTPDGRGYEPSNEEEISVLLNDQNEEPGASILMALNVG